MKKNEFLRILLCLCMVASLVLIPAPQASAAVDTSKLDGVYNADFYGTVLYVLTFDNGKLTIEDKNNGALTGEYKYTVNEDGIPVVTKADGSDCGFLMSKDMGGNLTIQPAGFAMPMTLTKVAELGATTDKPAIDTSKLDGVYNADFYGTVLYVLTFDNGKLTIEDKNNGALTGEYKYTVNEDGIPVVTKADGSDCGFLMSKNMGGFLTIQPAGFAMPMDLTKVAELGGSDAEETLDSFTVTTTDTYAWDDEYTFTAEKAGDYTFIVPAGLSVVNLGDPNAQPYIDFNSDNDGGEFTVTLEAGQSIRFGFSAATKAEWTISWKMEAPIITGTIEATTTENNGWFDVVTFTAPEDADYTFTLPAGLGAWEKNAQENFSADPYVDFVTDNDGGTFTVTLKKGETFSFYIGSKVKADWTITWTTAKNTTPELPGPAVVLGENTIGIGMADMMAQAVEYYFVVEVAGNYTFASDAFMVRIFQGEMMVNTGFAYLQPGVYKLVLLFSNVQTPGEYKLTITTDAVIGNNALQMGENTIEYGEDAIKDGLTFTFEVTESGTYRFEGDLLASVTNANGMSMGRYEMPLEPGTYTVALYNINETAGTFVVNIIIVTEEQMEQEAIDNVIGLIEAIGEVTLESKDAIQTARDFYNALSDESKAKVSNVSILEAAEKALAALETPDEPGDEPGNEPGDEPSDDEPTTPATQPNGNDGDDEKNGSPAVIIVIVVIAVVVVAVILFSKKKKA